MQLRVFAAWRVVKTLGHDLGPVQVTCPASHACLCQLSFLHSGLKSFCGVCFKECHLPGSSSDKGLPEVCRPGEAYPLHSTALSSCSHPDKLPSKAVGTPASAAGHNYLAGPELCMLDGASLWGRKEVLALYCWVHTHRVSLTGTFPSCSLKNLGCNFAWMQGMYSVTSVCWELSKLSWFLPGWKVC